MNIVLAELREAETKRQAKALADCQSLVRKLGQRWSKGAQRHYGNLRAPEKTLAELDAAVGRVQARAALRLKIAQASEADAEIIGLNAEINMADRELDGARERHRLAVWPLQSRLAEIQSLQMGTRDAERELLRLTTPEEKKRLDDAQRTADSARESAAAASRSMARLETAVECASDGGERAEYQRELAGAKDRFATASAKLLRLRRHSSERRRRFWKAETTTAAHVFVNARSASSGAAGSVLLPGSRPAD